MGRAPCCDKEKVKKGPWSPEEDAKLKDYIEMYGTGGNWIALPPKAGLRRCGKSCRLRWLNYLRPNIKHGEFSDEEDRIICSLFANIGSRWSIIASQLPGRTDNDIKNYWNTKLKKKLMGIASPPHNNNKKSTQQEPTPYHPTSSNTQTTSPSSLIPPQAALSPSSSSSPFTFHHSLISTFLNFPTPVPALSLTAGSSLSTTTNPLISLLGNSSNTLSSYEVFQTTQDGYLSTMQRYDHLMFGGADQPSCSSSDGSCSNQINHGRGIDYHHEEAMANANANANANAMVPNGELGDHGSSEKPNLDINGFLVDAGVLVLEQQEIKGNEFADQKPIDEELVYELEMISKLISSTNKPCNNFNWFVESKTAEDRVMYY